MKRTIDSHVAKKLAAELKTSISADLKGDAVKRVLDDVPVKGGKKIRKEDKIRSDVEEKFAIKKKFLINSYERALYEE